jgi:hypothetical protein
MKKGSIGHSIGCRQVVDAFREVDQIVAHEIGNKKRPLQDSPTSSSIKALIKAFWRR